MSTPSLPSPHLAEIEAPGNVIIISIPSVLDPTLAPEGCHTLHAYTAGNEPFEPWAGLDRKSPEYQKLKEERAEVLWKAVEKVIPDVRSRLKVSDAVVEGERRQFRGRGSYRRRCFAQDD